MAVRHHPDARMPAAALGQPVKRGDTAARAQRLNTTRNVRGFVPLLVANVVRATTRWVPNFSTRGLIETL